MKILDILRKLGIYRSGSYSGTYKLEDRPVEMMMDNVYDAKKDLITKEDLKNLKKIMTEENKKEEVVNKNENVSSSEVSSETKSKIKFWIAVVIAAFFLLVMSGKTIWFLIGLVMWGVLLFWLGRGEGKTASTGVVAGVVGGAIFVSLILIGFAEPNSGAVTMDFSVEKNNGVFTKNVSTEKSQMTQEEINVQAIVTLLNSLGGIIKTESTQAVPMASVVWTTANTSLVLEKAFSVTLKGLDEREIKNLQKYFEENLKATTGGVGFEFVPPVNTLSAGFLISNEQFASLMCVWLVEERGKGEIIVSCGYGPGGRANFVEKR